MTSILEKTLEPMKLNKRCHSRAYFVTYIMNFSELSSSSPFDVTLISTFMSHLTYPRSVHLSDALSRVSCCDRISLSELLRAVHHHEL